MDITISALDENNQEIWYKHLDDIRIIPSVGHYLDIDDEFYIVDRIVWTSIRLNKVVIYIK